MTKLWPFFESVSTWSWEVHDRTRSVKCNINQKHVVVPNPKSSFSYYRNYFRFCCFLADTRSLGQRRPRSFKGRGNFLIIELRPREVDQKSTFIFFFRKCVPFWPSLSISLGTASCAITPRSTGDGGTTPVPPRPPPFCLPRSCHPRWW